MLLITAPRLSIYYCVLLIGRHTSFVSNILTSQKWSSSLNEVWLSINSFFLNSTRCIYLNLMKRSTGWAWYGFIYPQHPLKCGLPPPDGGVTAGWRGCPSPRHTLTRRKAYIPGFQSPEPFPRVHTASRGRCWTHTSSSAQRALCLLGGGGKPLRSKGAWPGHGAFPGGSLDQSHVGRRPALKQQGWG